MAIDALNHDPGKAPAPTPDYGAAILCRVAQAALIAELRTEVAELRQRSVVAGPGVPERRASKTETFDADPSGQKPRKGG